MNMRAEPKDKPGAIFHFACKVHGRSSGANAVRLAAYRAGERLRSELTGRIHNFTRKREVINRQILAPANAPAWALDRARLWNAIDNMETRKDAQLAREVEVALPLILGPNDNLELLRAWVGEIFVAAGMVADIAYHAKRGNPHAHILLTLRDIGPDGFGKKNRSWNAPRLLETWRESWAGFVNTFLEKAGLDIRIDHRSYRRRGVDLTPTRHIGRANLFNQEKIETLSLENRLIEIERELQRQKIAEGNKQKASGIAPLNSGLATAVDRPMRQRRARRQRAPGNAVPTPTPSFPYPKF
jgi:ATP-dependent exoDNAse (exonuclease V) alpha subunit